MKDTEKPATRTTATDSSSAGFPDEERAAMKERAQELTAASRRGRGPSEAEDESAVLAKIAEMPAPNRALAERPHAVITANAPDLAPKL
jgi:hypothetical protein